MIKNYDDSSIAKLEGADRIRFRPGAMLGSSGIDGARHTVYEIVGNASDEQLSGYGDKLEIGYYEDGSVSVRDYGRGVPLGWNEKYGEWNYFLIYEELYAGGKYQDSQEILKGINERDEWDTFNLKDYPYLITIGLNGLGAAATQCTSEYCIVSSIRDGVKKTMRYEKGKHVLDELIVEETSEENGTLVHWKPDSEVFTDVDLKAKWLERLCRNLAYTADFNVIFNNKGKVTEFAKSTISEQMKIDTGNVAYAENFVHEVDDAGDVCICFANIAVGPGGRGNEYFHNKVEMRGGVHSEGVNTAESIFFEDRGKERGIRIKSVDYSGKLSVIVSTLSNKMSPRGQTKDAIDDTYVFRCIYRTLYDLLNLEWSKGSGWLEDIVNEVVQNAENRMTVQELSKQVKEIDRAVKSAKTSEKFIPCEEYVKKNYHNVEMWIPEGDSAGDTAKNARDARFQCIMKIRGKSLNVYKASIQQILDNREIRDIIGALGCGVDLKLDEIETFDITKLRVNKIIFVPDADVDGNHIGILLFLIFWKLFPELLYQGYVYIAQTPLYVIHLKSDESIFCMTEEELKQKRAEIGEFNIKEITRFKGLGELNSDQLWDTTMNPETRTLIQLKIDRNDADVEDVLEVFFGKSTERRKKAILGSMLGVELDTIMENIEEMTQSIEGMNLSSVEYESVEV